MGAAHAVIGSGPRGISVLERFVSHANRDPRRRHVVVHLVDPGPAGGIHHPEQPEHLLLNTVAAQLTAFVDDAMIDGGGVSGPSLYEWALHRGIPVEERRGVTRPARPDDHLPRAVLGEYLQWAFERILDAAPPWLDIRRHPVTAVDVRRTDDGREDVLLGDGTSLRVTSVVLCVGHTAAAQPECADATVPADAWIGNPYPMPGALAGIGPGERIGVLGGGLTAMDVISELTVGRGGRYRETEHGPRYVPSGSEPTIVLVTRTGLPARARPLPYRTAPLPARHLTVSAMERLRSHASGGRVNLRRDLLPLVNAEMRHRISAMEPVPEVAAELMAQAGTAWDARVPSTALHSARTYRDWFVDQVEQDLVEARRGLDSSPLKAALETLRDFREVLRHSVDAPGMDEPSLAEFFGSFAGTINRNVICPQLERNEELVALIRAGVLSPGLGPGTGLVWSRDRWELTSTALAEPGERTLSRIVCAYSPAPRISRSTSSVVQRLCRAGRLFPVVVRDLELGVRLSGRGFALDARGRCQPSLAVLGPLAEGSSYYNHYVTSPGVWSRATVDADRVVRSLTSDSPSMAAGR